LIIIYILSFLLNSGGTNINGLDRLLHMKFRDYEKIEYELVKPKSYSSISVEPHTKINKSGNYVYLSALVKRKDGSVKTEMISLKVRLYNSVLISKVKLKKNEKLALSDFQLIEADVTNNRKTPFTKIEDLEFYRTKSILHKGSILNREDVEMEPIVYRGDKLKAKYAEGSVMIELSVIAKQDGYFGKIIRVANGHKTYSAKIIDRNTVLIME